MKTGLLLASAAVVASQTLTREVFQQALTDLQTHFATGGAGADHVPTIANMVWTDCLDACKGCVSNTHPEFQGAGNALETVYQTEAYRTAMSRGDFWALAANVGYVLRSTNRDQRPTFALTNLVDNFRFGRPRVTCSAAPVSNATCAAGLPAWQACSEEPVLPQDTGGFASLQNIMQRNNLGMRDATALLGAHTFGTKNRDQTMGSGFASPWTRNQRVFDNEYYEWIMGPNDKTREWFQVEAGTAALEQGQNNPPVLYLWLEGAARANSDFNGFTTALNVDLSLLYEFPVDETTGLAFCGSNNRDMRNREFAACKRNPTNIGLVQQYRDNYQLWMNDFANAWRKHTENDQAASGMSLQFINGRCNGNECFSNFARNGFRSN